jgi:hypothetical protein
MRTFANSSVNGSATEGWITVLGRGPCGYPDFGEYKVPISNNKKAETACRQRQLSFARKRMPSAPVAPVTKGFMRGTPSRCERPGALRFAQFLMAAWGVLRKLMAMRL